MNTSQTQSNKREFFFEFYEASGAPCESAQSTGALQNKLSFKEQFLGSENCSRDYVLYLFSKPLKY